MIASARKYHWIIGGTLFLFLYLLPTEVWDRWKETGVLYDELSTKSEQSPEKLAQKKIALQAKQQTLTSVLTRNAGQFEQSQTGVVEFLNATAREAGVKLESLAPTSPEASGQIQEIAFSLRLTSDFHSLGKFLNSLERSGTIVRVKSLEVTPSETNRARLSARIEGSAYIVPKRNKP